MNKARYTYRHIEKSLILRTSFYVFQLNVSVSISAYEDCQRVKNVAVKAMPRVRASGHGLIKSSCVGCLFN